MPDRDEWDTEHFDLLSMFPCLGVTAVFAVESEEHPGQYVLETHPVDALALAEVTVKRRTAMNRDGRVVEKYKHVVGLELVEGYFQVVNDNSNFAGLAKNGQDPYECTGSLDWSKYKLVKPTQDKSTDA